MRRRHREWCERTENETVRRHEREGVPRDPEWTPCRGETVPTVWWSPFDPLWAHALHIAWRECDGVVLCTHGMVMQAIRKGGDDV